MQQPAIYTTISLSELLGRVQALKGAAAHFVQMHAERDVDTGTYRLVYTFLNEAVAKQQVAQNGTYAYENLVLENITEADDVPSISTYYPAVFPFENEAHDLFGIHITDMQMDFEGFFYNVAIDKPMSIISPEIKAAREKAAKVRAAKEAKARKAAAEKAAAAKTAAEGEGAAEAKPAAAAGNDAAHDEAEAQRQLKRAEMEAKIAAMDPEKAAKVRAALAAKEAREKAKEAE